MKGWLHDDVILIFHGGFHFRFKRIFGTATFKARVTEEARKKALCSDEPQSIE